MIPPTEVAPALRQLRLRVDIPQVEEILPTFDAEWLSRRAFETLVDNVLEIQQAIDERRDAHKATLGSSEVRAVLSLHKRTIEALFVEHATERSMSERAISPAALIEMLTALGLVPARTSEPSVRLLLRDFGIAFISLEELPEVLLALATQVSARSPDRNVPPERRLSELLSAIERTRADPSKEAVRVAAEAETAKLEERDRLRAAETQRIIEGAQAPKPQPADETAAAQSAAAAAKAALALEKKTAAAALAVAAAEAAIPAGTAGSVSVAGRRAGSSSIGKPGKPSARDMTSPRDHPAGSSSELEVESLRRHVASLEASLVQAEDQLRKVGIHSTRLKDPADSPRTRGGQTHTAAQHAARGNSARAAELGRNPPRYKFERAKQGFEHEAQFDGGAIAAAADDEHSATLMHFARMRTRVASLAARNTALEQSGKVVQQTQQTAAAREQQISNRERILHAEVQSLKAQNAKLETQLTASKTAAREVSSGGSGAREDLKGRAAKLLQSDGKCSVSFAAAAGGTAGADPVQQVVALEGTLRHVREQLAASNNANAALTAQLHDLEKRIGVPPVDASGVGLLEYAASMRMRPIGSTPPPTPPPARSLPPVGASGGASGTVSTSSSGTSGVAGSTVGSVPIASAPNNSGSAGGHGKASLAAVHHQWVDDVGDCSSQRDRDAFGAHQLVGPPRVYPMHGNVAGAWQPSSSSATGGDGDGAGAAGTAAAAATSAFVELSFAKFMYVSGVEIYETHAAGSVTSVAVWSGKTDGSGKGGWDVVWKGDAQAADGGSRIFAPPIEQRSYATRHLRLELALERTSGKSAKTFIAPQIDAVRLLGMRAPTDAAPQDSPPRRAGAAPARPRIGPASSCSNPFAAPGPGTDFRTFGSMRHAEAEIASLKDGHAHELKHLRAYIDQLKGYSKSLREELDACKVELKKRDQIFPDLPGAAASL